MPINSRENLEKIGRFPIGTPISYKNNKSIRFAVVTGFSLNPSGELVFRVTRLIDQLDQLMHPVYVEKVDYDWDRTETNKSPKHSKVNKL